MLIVSLGRLGDMVGRVQIYNLGFVIYTVASLLLAVDWMDGRAGAGYLIVFRIVQGVGGACLLANAAAIITDAFPANQRGMALGINNIVGVSGMFIGLVLGGILAPIDWRLVFLISVPVGLFGTVWAYLRAARAQRRRGRAPIDWPGNVTFALGLVLLMVAVTYGIRPARRPRRSAGAARACSSLLAGSALVCLVAFVVDRDAARRDPMFRLPLFRIRAFTFGTLSTFLSAVARGGLMFMLIIWLQGIWLPQHGYGFTETPLWAGIYMLPLTRRDARRRARRRATSPTASARARSRPAGCSDRASASGCCCSCRPTSPTPSFARDPLLIGISMGLFASPNRAAVMNSLPRGDRGAGGAMNQTFQNSAQVLSIGIFFTLMIVGLAATLPDDAEQRASRPTASSAARRHRVAHLPPVSILFAAFLGYNPIQHLLGPHVLAALSAAQPRGAHRPLVLPAR